MINEKESRQRIMEVLYGTRDISELRTEEITWVSNVLPIHKEANKLPSLSDLLVSPYNHELTDTLEALGLPKNIQEKVSDKFLNAIIKVENEGEKGSNSKIIEHVIQNLTKQDVTYLVFLENQRARLYESLKEIFIDKKKD